MRLIINLNDPEISKNRAEELLNLVKWQTGFGCRYPGSPEHTNFITGLFNKLNSYSNKVIKQNFKITLNGQETACTNLITLIISENKKKEKPVLLGTHFDTRLIADNEKDPELRDKPILGSNDGGSGTAVLLHLLDIIKNVKFNRDIVIVLFDAEDVGNISGNPFSVGARFFAENPVPCLPSEALILDMVGGKNLVPDIDAHILGHKASFEFTQKIFGIAAENKIDPFLKNKENKYKYIICDHTPFMLKDIPACILIDIDYPEWHTQRDTPKAMSGESLVAAENLVLKYLEEYIIE